MEVQEESVEKVVWRTSGTVAVKITGAGKGTSEEVLMERVEKKVSGEEEEPRKDPSELIKEMRAVMTKDEFYDLVRKTR